MNKVIYVLYGMTSLITGIRVIAMKEYKYNHYPALELGKYSLAVGVFIIITGLYSLYVAYIKHKQAKVPKYTKCPKCKKSYNYIDTNKGKCPTCNIDTMEIDDYYKKFPKELKDARK